MIFSTSPLSRGGSEHGGRVLIVKGVEGSSVSNTSRTVALYLLIIIKFSSWYRGRSLRSSLASSVLCGLKTTMFLQLLYTASLTLSGSCEGYLVTSIIPSLNARAYILQDEIIGLKPLDTEPRRESGVVNPSLSQKTFRIDDVLNSFKSF